MEEGGDTDVSLCFFLCKPKGRGNIPLRLLLTARVCFPQFSNLVALQTCFILFTNAHGVEL